MRAFSIGPILAVGTLAADSTLTLAPITANNNGSTATCGVEWTTEITESAGSAEGSTLLTSVVTQTQTCNLNFSATDATEIDYYMCRQEGSANYCSIWEWTDSDLYFNQNHLLTGALPIENEGNGINDTWPFDSSTTNPDHESTWSFSSGVAYVPDADCIATPLCKIESANWDSQKKVATAINKSTRTATYTPLTEGQLELAATLSVLPATAVPLVASNTIVSGIHIKLSGSGAWSQTKLGTQDIGQQTIIGELESELNRRDYAQKTKYEDDIKAAEEAKKLEEEQAAQAALIAAAAKDDATYLSATIAMAAVATAIVL